MATPIEKNTATIRAILDKVNQLPDAGGGSPTPARGDILVEAITATVYYLSTDFTVKQKSVRDGTMTISDAFIGSILMINQSAFGTTNVELVGFTSGTTNCYQITGDSFLLHIGKG